MDGQISTKKTCDNEWEVKNKKTGQIAKIVSFIDHEVYMRNPRTRYRVDVNGITVSGIIEHFQTAKKQATQEVTKPLPTQKTMPERIEETTMCQPSKPFHERLYEAFKRHTLGEKKTFAIILKPYFISFRVEEREGRIVIEVSYSIHSERQREGLQYTFEETMSGDSYNTYLFPYQHPDRLKRILESIDSDTLSKMFASKNPVIMNKPLNV